MKTTASGYKIDRKMISLQNQNSEELPLLVIITDPGDVAGARAKVVALQGHFSDLSKTPLRIGDLTFEVSNHGRGFRLRVTLPTGPEAKWLSLIAPPEPDRRAAIRAAMDPDGETEQLGEEIKIQIDLPKEPVASGYRPDLSPVRDSVDKKRVTLIVKVDKLRAGGRTVEWDVTW